MPIFHIFDKRTKNLLSPISMSTLLLSTFLFIHDGLFISQEKATKNQTQIYFVVIALFPLSLNNSVL